MLVEKSRFIDRQDRQADRQTKEIAVAIEKPKRGCSLSPSDMLFLFSSCCCFSSDPYFSLVGAAALSLKTVSRCRRWMIHSQSIDAQRYCITNESAANQRVASRACDSSAVWLNVARPLMPLLSTGNLLSFSAWRFVTSSYGRIGCPFRVVASTSTAHRRRTLFIARFCRYSCSPSFSCQQQHTDTQVATETNIYKNKKKKNKRKRPVARLWIVVDDRKGRGDKTTTASQNEAKQPTAK